MNKKMILLFSHTLSDEQKNDAIQNFEVEEFVSLPNELQKLWSNFDADLEKLDLEPLQKFLISEVKSGDVVLVQGDFGASFKMVQFALEHELIPVYATTKREVFEVVENGQTVKKSIFKHRRFRRYGN